MRELGDVRSISASLCKRTGNVRTLVPGKPLIFRGPASLQSAVAGSSRAGKSLPGMGDAHRPPPASRLPPPASRLRSLTARLPGEAPPPGHHPPTWPRPPAPPAHLPSHLRAGRRAALLPFPRPAAPPPARAPAASPPPPTPPRRSPQRVKPSSRDSSGGSESRARLAAPDWLSSCQ